MKRGKARIQKRRRLEPGPGFSLPITRHATGFVLNIVALAYALIAGFHTFFDLDLGWHMATGRYVLQHHIIPATDVLSFTSPGAAWIYPPFAGVLFYLIHQSAGYVGLTWFCAASLVAVIACILESPSHPSCYATAILAILAVPAVALRFTPRPDLFTHLFFAIYLVQLWRFHRCDEDAVVLRKNWRFRLWILPLLMILWVNLHPGFIVGLGAIFAYALVEGLDVFFLTRRAAAIQRLKLAWLALLATPLSTLLNPFGFKIYASAVSLFGFAHAGQAKSALDVLELQGVRLTLPSMALALDWRDPDSCFWWLVLLALVALGLALSKKQFGSAAILLLALVAGTQRVRYEGLFAIAIVVVASDSLTGALVKQSKGADGLQPLSWLQGSLAFGLVLLICVRTTDLASSRPYIVAGGNEVFGAGESSWFPERAADFILHEHLRGNLFEEYNLGGFAAWRLGSTYPVYIDGRGVSIPAMNEYDNVVSTEPDSPAWQEEVDRRDINIILFSLTPNPGALATDVRSFCKGHLFRPVYMDESSIVLLRDTPRNRPLIDRLQIDCETHEFPAAAGSSRAPLAGFYANVGTIELNLGRDGEAQQTLERSEALAPEDPSVHMALAQIFFDQQRPSECEQELKTAVSLRIDGDEAWRRLARFYYFYRRFDDARSADWRASQLAAHPEDDYTMLGSIDMNLHQDKQALADFDRAEEAAAEYRGQEDNYRNLFAEIAAGRASVFAAEKDWKTAILYQQEATRRVPENASQWQALADMYEAAGELQLAEQAREKVRTLNGGS